jgi:T4 bacteriophage base plate protein
MKLPKIETPIYQAKLLSIKEPVMFRPFLVKEQKLMLQIVEERDPKESIKITKTIIKNCLLDQSIDVDALPSVDIEILFLNFRARSMGENLDVFFKCKNLVGDGEEKKECGMVIESSINLLEVPVANQDYNNRIMISDDIGIQMKLPTFEIVESIANVDANVENSEFKSIAMCIDFIFEKENVYYAKDATLEELIEFIVQLPPEKYELITKYFNNIPIVRKELDKECSKCGFKHKFVLEGLNDFFI